MTGAAGAVVSNVTVIVSAAATAKLAPLHAGHYDLQILRADANVGPLY